MAVRALRARLDEQITALQVEKQRIRDQAIADVAAVDIKLDALRAAKDAVTPAIETAYVALLALGLIHEV
jgi:hypothetical protein